MTHQGKVRTTNQDRVLVLADSRLGGGTALLAVADGMGGLAHGERASAIVVETLQRWWQMRTVAPLLALSHMLDEAIYEAHRQVYFFSEDMQQKAGSTLSLLLLQGEDYLIKQIGDSRIYCLGPQGLELLTVDQNWYNQMVRTGQLTPQQAEQNRKCRALVNALGASEELEIASDSGHLVHKQHFLLCTDGLYNSVSPQFIAAVLAEKRPQQALDALMEEVLLGSATDNLSAVSCFIG